MAAAYLDTCQQLAITDVEVLAIHKENQRLTQALSHKEAKILEREDRLAQLQGTEARTRLELQHAEDQRTAAEAAL